MQKYHACGTIEVLLNRDCFVAFAFLTLEHLFKSPKEKKLTGYSRITLNITLKKMMNIGRETRKLSSFR